MRAKKILNFHKPEYPPEIYYIRRTPALMDKYLRNKEELNQVVRDAPE